MAKHILIDFYRVKFPGTLDFKTILNKLNMTPADNRIYTVKEPIRLEKLERNDVGQWEGHLVKIRMDLLPKKASVKNGGLEDIDLDADEGIGEEVSFLYDEGLNVMLYQRNFHGIRIDTFGEFIQRFCKDKNIANNAIPDFQAIIGTDAINKLKKQTVMRRMEVTIAVPTSTEALRALKQNQLTSSWIDSINASGSDRLAIQLSLGGVRSKSLKAKMVAAAAQIALKQRDFVDKFKVRAKDDEHSLEWIDVLEDRTHRYVEVDVSRKSPLTHARMALELTKVWDDMASELAAYFKSGER